MDDFGASLPPGTRLDEFEIVRVLGIGGFGITYLAHDATLGHEVAIKEYFPADFAFRQNTLSITPRSEQHAENFQWGLQRFLEEARILARLNHPSIIKVSRFFEAYGSAYIVMQYIAGRPLSEEIKEKGALPEPRVKAIVMALMDGLEQVHEANLLHRDIKPSNVMVQPDGAPVLIDFGAARNISSQHSRTMTAVLTPGYAPIEQYGSLGHQGPWTDIYSLGALAYKCLTGVVPKDATDRFREDQLQAVSQMVSEEISKPFARAIDIALSVMESARPQSISQWREIFEGSTSGTFFTEQEGPSPQSVSGRGSQEPSDEPRLHGLVGTRKSRALRRAGSKGIRGGFLFLFHALGLLGLVAIMTVVSREDLASMLPWMNEAATFSGGLSGTVTEDALGDTVSSTVAVTDSDGEDTLQVQTDKAGVYGTFTLETSGVWTYTLDNADPDTNALAEGVEGTDAFPIQAADGTAGQVVITVTGANDAPVAEAGNNQIVFMGDSMMLDGSGSNDPDRGSTLSYAWKQEWEKKVRLANADMEQASFTVPPTIAENLMLTFTLTVSDGLGGVDSDDVFIIVLDDQGITRLHQAAESNSTGVAKQLLLDDGADPNVTTDGGRTPLHFTAAADSAEVAKLLLDADVNPNAASDEGRTPLHIAAFTNSAEVAKLLLKNGANVNATDKDEGTPLHAAAWWNSAEVAKLLLENGANVNATDKDEDTPLHAAAWWNSAEVAKLLLENGANVNATDEDEDTPLHAAAWWNSAEVAKLLLENGANVNATDDLGWTPLRRAVLNDSAEVAKLLLDAGARK